MKKLLLGLLSLVLYFSSAIVVAGECLIDNRDGTLTDPNTGLIWQACAIGQDWTGTSCQGNATKYTWDDALLAAADNRFQDKEDWILPTRTQNRTLRRTCSPWSDTNRKFWSSSSENPYSAWMIYFNGGGLPYAYDTFMANGHMANGMGDTSKQYEVRLVRASQVSDVREFQASLAPVKNAQNRKLELQREAVELQRRESEAQDAFEPYGRANTVVGYSEFIKKFPDSKMASTAKDGIRLLLEPSILKAEAAFKCEAARQLDKPTEAAGMSPLSSFDSCVDKRKFNNVLNLKNPQQQYLEAVKYENDNERSRAKRIYLTIMDKSSTSPIALKAADRLSNLKSVEAVESASDTSRAAAERAAEASRRAGEASREAAYSVNRRNADQCQKDQNACWRGCDVYKNSSQRDSCKSGCASCAN